MTISLCQRTTLAVLAVLLMGAGACSKASAPGPVSVAPAENSIDAVRKRADAGDAAAQYDLGNLHYHGQGVAQNDAQAVAWYRKAAAQGDAGGQYNLGFMYANGKGVPKDYVEAHKWHNLAAAHASAENQKKWAAVRDSLEKDMTPQQIADAQKRASDWQATFDKRTK